MKILSLLIEKKFLKKIIFHNQGLAEYHLISIKNKEKEYIFLIHYPNHHQEKI